MRRRLEEHGREVEADFRREVGDPARRSFEERVRESDAYEQQRREQGAK